MKSTMADVAAAAGVSPMTVSNCYKHPHKVHAETREKVLAMAAALGYVPNQIASSLASGHNRTITAVVPSLSNSSFARTIQGLGDYLESQRFELLLAVAEDPQRETQVIRGILGRRPAGIVLTGGEHTDETIRLIQQSGVPVVETWLSSAPSIDMAVGFSLSDAAYDMTRLVIDKGLRHIGWAGHNLPDSQRYLQRQQGFQRAMEEAGLRADLIHLSAEAEGFAGGRLAIEALLKKERRLQALCCVTDVVAAGALFECARRRWKVPGRFAVAGYGDYQIAAEVPPGLTSVKTNGAAIGQAAGELLVQRIETGQVDDLVRRVPYEIIVRGSV